MKRLDIVYVEDDAEDVMLFEDHIHPDRHRIILCRTLEEGISTVRKTSPDLLLLDLNLPDANGVEAVRRMRGLFPEIPILVFSGIDDDTIGREAVAHGAQGYLVKGDAHLGMLDRVLRDAILHKERQNSHEDYARFIQNLLVAQRQIHRLEKRSTELPLEMCRLLVENLGIPCVRWTTHVPAAARASVVIVHRREMELEAESIESTDITPLEKRVRTNGDTFVVIDAEEASILCDITGKDLTGWRIAVATAEIGVRESGVLTLPIPEDLVQYPEIGNLIDGLTRDLAVEITTTRLREEADHARSMAEQALEEKEVLLREIHHRVKNNLQIIMSLLRLYVARFTSPDVSSALQEYENKIFSIALAHEHLYESENVSHIALDPFLERIAKETSDLFERGREIVVHLNCEQIFLPLGIAVPVALVASELITNSHKHAFPNGRTGNIWIDAELMDDGHVRMCVRDDGVGCGAGQGPSTDTHFGHVLIDSLAKQISAEVVTTREDRAGTETYLLFYPGEDT